MFTVQNALSVLNLWKFISFASCLSALRSTSNTRRYIEDDSSEEIQGRIVGGQLIGQGAVKHQLHFSYKGFMDCGATLVEVYAIQIAVTATHCLWKGYPNRESVGDARYIEVTAGDRRLSDYNSREQTRNVTKVVAHPDYDPKFFGNDILLMFLSSNFKSTPWVDPVDLPGHDWELPKKVEVSGWGSNVYGGELQNDLRWVEVPVVDPILCDKYNAIPWVEIVSTQFCVGELGGRQIGSCSGDSGGPAVAYNATTDASYLAGVISFQTSPVCGHPLFPTVYTRVSSYVDWIRIEVSKYREENNLSK